MSDTLLSAIIGGLFGAAITAAIALYIGNRERQQNYYAGLAKLLAEHNWNRLKEKIPPGLPITQVDEKTSIRWALWGRHLPCVVTKGTQRRNMSQ